MRAGLGEMIESLSILFTVLVGLKLTCLMDWARASLLVKGREGGVVGREGRSRLRSRPP